MCYPIILAFAKVLEFIPLNVNAISSTDDISIGTIRKDVYEKYSKNIDLKILAEEVIKT